MRQAILVRAGFAVDAEKSPAQRSRLRIRTLQFQLPAAPCASQRTLRDPFLFLKTSRLGAVASEPLTERISHTSRLWRWTSPSGPAAWFFLTIDGAAGEALSGTALMRRMEKSIGGFGSLKVEATIGGSTFKTSVFPSKSQGWMLPVKASVRKAEGLGEGDAVDVVLEF